MGLKSDDNQIMRQSTIRKKAAELKLATIEVRKNEIEGSHEEVETLLAALGFQWGGFTTGYGTLIVRENYQSDPFDFNNRASKHHY